MSIALLLGARKELKHHLLYLTFFLISFNSLTATPTERFLKQTSIEEIKAAMQPAHRDHITTLEAIAKQEDEETFFGYHGLTQKHRLFQDVLRAVFEEYLDIELPKNFYFLRIPGATIWDWKKGKESFLTTFNERKYPEDEFKAVVKNLFKQIKDKLGLAISFNALSKKEYATLKEYFQHYMHVEYQEQWIRKAERYTLPIRYKWKQVEKHKNFSKVLSVIKKHAQANAPQTDLAAIEAGMQDLLTSDFSPIYIDRLFYAHKPLEQQQKFYEYWLTFAFPYNDTVYPQQAMLVSMNVPLFANSSTSGCFTPEIFLANESVMNGDSHLLDSLGEFFNEIGLSSSMASSLWEDGEAILLQDPRPTGCLLQFYNESALQGAQPFSFVNKNSYLSFRHGLPVQDLVPTKYITGKYILERKEKDFTF